jgi:hypothetical protein
MKERDGEAKYNNLSRAIVANAIPVYPEEET